jgi:hypothetical protein
MEGSQGDYQCAARHAWDVGDVVESRRGEIAGIIVSIDAMALCAVSLSKPTALSGIADLLRV